jgi:DNA primase
MGDYVDFKALKAVATVEAVAARYGVELRQVNASHKRGRCPFPAHPAGDDKESFSVNVEKRVWICHSAPCAKGRKGKKGGDVIELVAAIEGCSLRDAGLKIAGWFPVAVQSSPPVEQPVGENVGAPEPPAPPPVRVEAVTVAGDEYGVYAPLCAWVEEQIKNDHDLERLERYLLYRVLAKARALAKE